MVHRKRITMMVIALIAGLVWLAPRRTQHAPADVRFSEQAAPAGCLHQHTMVRLSNKFDNMMPWLSPVDADAATGGAATLRQD